MRGDDKGRILPLNRGLAHALPVTPDAGPSPSGGPALPPRRKVPLAATAHTQKLRPQLLFPHRTSLTPTDDALAAAACPAAADVSRNVTPNS